MLTVSRPAGRLERIVAWTGAALFAASLLYFLYFYAVRLGRDTTASPPSSALPAVVTNTALFVVFALHHSLFARGRVKRRVAAALPSLERSAYVWTASLLLMSVCLLWQPVPGIVWVATGPWRWILVAVQATGVALTLLSARIIDIWDLAGIRQLDPRPARGVPDATPSDTPVFKTAGPYGLVRHPIYLGWIVLVFAIPTMTGGRLLFAVISSLYLVLAIPLEERSLVQDHGDAYLAYQHDVPWRLLPGVW